LKGRKRQDLVIEHDVPGRLEIFSHSRRHEHGVKVNPF